MMNIRQIVKIYSEQLKAKSNSPILDIEILLTKALNKPKEYLYEYSEKNLTTPQFSKFNKLFKRRLKGEPVAYLLGHKEFYNLDFKVNKNVLIPRPETEIIAEETLKYYKSQISDFRSQSLIIEIGVGSGAIIIALAKNIKKAEFIATDISAKALKISKQNAKFHKVKIEFLKGNLLQPLPKFQNLDFSFQNSIIVANLPYLTAQEMKNSTIQSEPNIALNGGPDGLKYFRQLFAQIQKYNLKPKAIFLEIGHKQADKIIKLAGQVLPKYKFKVIKDLCGHDRVVEIIK